VLYRWILSAPQPETEPPAQWLHQVGYTCPECRRRAVATVAVVRTREHTRLEEVAARCPSCGPASPTGGERSPVLVPGAAT
jgi:hypothetical protein